MSKFDCDLFVIGGGSGGVRAARIAASHGARVVIAEEYRYGGTCVIRGCVPKKLLVFASRFSDDFEDAAGFGWSVGETSFDWATLIANKDKEITRLEGLYKKNLERVGVVTHDARAVVTGPNSVRLEPSGTTMTAERILVATGGWPGVDKSIEGHQHALTSNEAFHLAVQPPSILIVGGGYIAVEFAGIFAGLGTDVTLAYRGAKILRGFDEDLRDGLTEELERRGIRIITNATVREIESTTGSVMRDGRPLRTPHVVTFATGERMSAYDVMFATGRMPNTTGLGLEAAGVTLGPKGEVKVDRHARTNVASIYAVGDVTDRVNLTPVAIREGHAFADSVYGNRPWSTDYDTIPTAVFSTPEIGTVGLTEAEARAKFGAIDLYKARFRPMRGTLSGREERMLMKLVVGAGDGRVLGCHILGPDAGEMVQMAAIAMRMGATKADFDRTMALHPSAAEELVTMREKWMPPVAAKA